MASRQLTLQRSVVQNDVLLSDSTIRSILLSRNGDKERTEKFESCTIGLEENEKFDYSKALKLLRPFVWPSELDERFKQNKYRGPFYYKAEEVVFIGQMNGDMRQGRGYMIYSDGNLYEGYFDQDTANIRGRLIFFDGDFYEGEVKDMSMHGQGVYYNNTGNSKYTGQFKEDKPHGKGKEVWNDGTMYEGDFVAGSKEGKGVFRTKEGSVYEGEFKAEVFHGQGVLTTSNQIKYRGTWKNAELQSPAEVIYEDGKVYEGEVNKQMKPHGKGTIKGPVKKYTGNFKDGMLDGQVIMAFNNGEHKTSIYKDGVFVRWVDPEGSVKAIKPPQEEDISTTKKVRPNISKQNLSPTNGTMLIPTVPQLQSSIQPRPEETSKTNLTDGQPPAKKKGFLCC